MISTPSLPPEQQYREAGPKMKMSKFERRKQEMQRKFEEEMKAIEEAEKKEIERRMEPIVSKIGKLAEEEARRALESDPAILENYSFRKREAACEMKDALDKIFSAQMDGADGDELEVEDNPPQEAAKAADAPKESEPEELKISDDPFDKEFGDTSAEDDGEKPEDKASESVKNEQQQEPQKKGFGPFGRG